jgi:exosome complex RNA-binding protein Rrp42 (RNase PH superfamily)
VYVVVRCEVVEPYADRPTEGFFIFNTEFSPMASPSVEVGGRYVINSRAAWTAVLW